MHKQKTLLAFLVLTFGVLLLATVSAQNYTLVAGKIYKNSFQDEVSGASITAVCNSFSLTTTSKSDGSYAIGFDPNIESCLEGATVTVSASENDWTGTDTGTVRVCDGNEDCDADFISVVNILIKAPQPSGNSGGGGGGGGYYYYCGNGKCDSGETSVTCPKDCKIVLLSENKSNIEENKPTATNDSLPSEPDESNSQQTNSFSRITGAVVGALTSSPPLTAIIIALVIILTASLIVRFRNAKATETATK